MSANDCCKSLGTFSKGDEIDLGIVAPCDATYLLEYEILGQKCTETLVLLQGDPIKFTNDKNETAFITVKVRPDLNEANNCAGFDPLTGVIYLTDAQGTASWCWRNVPSCVC